MPNVQFRVVTYLSHQLFNLLFAQTFGLVGLFYKEQSSLFDALVTVVGIFEQLPVYPFKMQLFTHNFSFSSFFKQNAHFF